MKLSEIISNRDSAIIDTSTTIDFNKFVLKIKDFADTEENLGISAMTKSQKPEIENTINDVNHYLNIWPNLHNHKNKDVVKFMKIIQQSAKRLEIFKDKL